MFVRVHDASCEMPGTISNKILRAAMSTMCIVQAPIMYQREIPNQRGCQSAIVLQHKPSALLKTSWEVIWTDLSNWPNWHSNLAMLPGHSYVLLSPEVPDTTDCSIASSSQFFRPCFDTDRSDVVVWSPRRMRQYEEGISGKTVWRL